MTTPYLQGLSLNALIKRIENAPDFGWDDEEVEMGRRGVRFKWVFNQFGEEVIQIVKT